MKYATNMKNIIKSCMPPIIMNFYRDRFKYVSKHIAFKAWWKHYSKDKDLPLDLISMIDHFITTPTFKISSRYWNWLNQKNIQQLNDFGCDNFKQTVAKNYFTWVGSSAYYYNKHVLKDINSIKTVVPIKVILKKHEIFSLDESILFNIMTILLFEYVTENGGDKYVNMIEEPLEGNPPFLYLKGRRISQDLLNSILEYIAIKNGCNLNRINSIMEIGAGYGRTSYCLMNLLPNVKYIIVDIPPALYISQNYLSKTFEHKKILPFKPFTSFKEIEDDFKVSDIIFLMPHQLELLPNKIIDLFIAIDCLHEMKTEQIEFYFNHIGRLANYFYYKCWLETKVPFDNLFYSSEDYPIKNNWNEIYKKACEVPYDYFDAFYEILL